MLAGPGVDGDDVERRRSTLALPLRVGACRLGMSPAWRSALPWWPCGLPCGLKCPLALMPSPELQSPASWMWKPNSPFGRRPVTLAATRTLSPRCSKFDRARTLLPLVGCRFAVAFGAVRAEPALHGLAAGEQRDRGDGERRPASLLGRLAGRHRGAALGLLVVGDRLSCALPRSSASFALAAAALSASAFFSASLFAGAAGSLACDAASAPIISPATRTARMRFHDFSFM